MKTYDTKELAEKCKCHVETILKDIREGRLAAAKFGRAYVVRQEDFDKYYEQSQYAVLQAMQAERSKKCQSDCVTESTRLMLLQPAVQELDALLARPIKSKPKNCTIN